MRKTLYILLILMTAFNISNTAYATSATKEALKDFFPAFLPKNQFAPGTEDIPLYKGFSIRKEKFLEFDNLDGNITHAEFSSNFKSKTKVIKFYENVLPEFGWHRVKGYPMVYKRDNEVLKIEVEKKTFLKTILKIDLKANNSR